MKFKISFLILLFVSFSARASFVEENLELKAGAKLKKTTGRAALVGLREFYLAKKWKDCESKSAEVAALAAQADVRPWVIEMGFECSLMQLKEAPAQSQFLKVFAQFEKNKVQIYESLAWKNMKPDLQKALEMWIEARFKSEPAKVQGWIDDYDGLFDDREARAKVLQWSGDLAFAQQKLKAADDFYSQSLILSESKNARDRRNSVRLAMNQKPPEGTPPKADVLSEAEEKFEKRFQEALKNNDLISFSEDVVSYLNAFPNGSRAKWAQDKLVDIYVNFADKAGTSKDSADKFISLRDKVLNQMEKLEATRAQNIARLLHRRSEFYGSLRLAERALLSLAHSPDGHILLFVAGRSAQFLGEYKKSRQHFENYLEMHRAADDSGEVQFRLALVHFRLEQYGSAAAVLERLLASKYADRYELSSRYWLVRSLQAQKSPRVDAEIDTILAKYPFSYYGLKLLLERKSSNLAGADLFAPAKNLKKTHVWSKGQKKIWDRALALAESGWIGEAMQEFSQLTFSTDPEVKAILAQKLLQSKVYPLAIRLTGEVLDGPADLRSAELLSFGLPQAYDEAISQQASKYNLSPFLVRSLIRQESAFNERATSVSKAMGLMQLIPPTAAEVAQDLGLQGIEVLHDSYVPAINVQMGTYYIARMIRQFGGNVPIGLAAYNAGPTKTGAFIRARPETEELIRRKSSEPKDEIWFDELPWNETSFYVKAILRNSIMYRLKSTSSVAFQPVLWSDLTVEINNQK